MDRLKEFNETHDKFVAQGEALTRRRSSSIFGLPAVTTSTSSLEDEALGMPQFFKDVPKLRERIETLDALLVDYRQHHEAALEAFSAVDRAKHEDRCGQAVGLMQREAGKIRSNLAQMENLNKQLVEQDPTVTKTGHYQMRVLQHAYLSEKFTMALKRFTQTQAELQAKREAGLERQYKVIRPNATDEELSRLHETEIPADELLKLAVRGTDLKEEMSRLLDRRDAMLRLEKRINELQALFGEMALLAQEQAEYVEGVALFVSKTHDYLEMTTQNLVQAVAYQKRIRKMWCSIF